MEREVRMNDKNSAPTREALDALSQELSAAFEASAAKADDATLSRLNRHTERLGATPESRPLPFAWMALAALALLGLGLSTWGTEVAEVPASLSVEEISDDELVWHAEDSSDGLDLLGLPMSSNDPERAMEIVDALIAELDNV